MAWRREMLSRGMLLYQGKCVVDILTRASMWYFVCVMVICLEVKLIGSFLWLLWALSCVVFCIWMCMLG